MNAPRQGRIVASVTALVVALGGCSMGGDEQTGPSTSAQSSPGPATTAPPSQGTAPTDAGDDPSRAIARQTVKARGARDATVQLAVLGLETRGKLATLSVSFTPNYPEKSPTEQISIYNMHGDQTPYVVLIDPVNLKRYSVVDEATGSGLSSDAQGSKTVNGGTVTAGYTFAAPPANVAKVDVQVGEWPVFRDVPIQR